MRLTVVGVLVLAACAGGDTGAATATDAVVAGPVADSTSTSTSTATSTSASPDRPERLPEGFAAVAAIVTGDDGTVCEVCLWLADTASQRRQGLMEVTDLGVASGMAFRYPDVHSGTFWMKNTVLPLSIAFFAPDGDFMASFDMEPCVTPTCPSYRTPDEFLVAIEVPQGRLDEFGLVPGSSLELLGRPCDD